MGCSIHLESASVQDSGHHGGCQSTSQAWRDVQELHQRVHGRKVFCEAHGGFWSTCVHHRWTAMCREEAHELGGFLDHGHLHLLLRQMLPHVSSSCWTCPGRCSVLPLCSWHSAEPVWLNPEGPSASRWCPESSGQASHVQGQHEVVVLFHVTASIHHCWVLQVQVLAWSPLQGLSNAVWLWSQLVHRASSCKGHQHCIEQGLVGPWISSAKLFSNGDHRQLEL